MHIIIPDHFSQVFQQIVISYNDKTAQTRFSLLAEVSHNDATSANRKTAVEHPFRPFRDYLKSPSYLKEGNLCWS